MYKKYLILFFLIFLMGCVSNQIANSSSEIKYYEKLYFDAVEKRILISDDVPESLKQEILWWFNNSVKVNGIEGDLTLNISDFNEQIVSNTNSKKGESSFKFKLEVVGVSSNQELTIEGQVESYAFIEGNFSLKEFDQILLKSQKDLILRLSNELNKNQFFQKEGKSKTKIVNISNLPRNIVIIKINLEQSDKEL